MRRHRSLDHHVGSRASRLDRVIAVLRVRQRDVHGLNVVALQALAKLVEVIGGGPMFLGECLTAAPIRRDDRGETRIAAGTRKRRKQRPLDDSAGADDGVTDLLAHASLPCSFSSGKGASKGPWSAVSTRQC
jgi:hypothetical protein